MARLVRLTATAPLKIEPGALPTDRAISLCLCGLSGKFPFCDGAHSVLRNEEPGKTYAYSPDGKTVVNVTTDNPPAG
ncbi:MAG: CDGSH iron-sulfur domain-containing protein [Phycisphaerales bacterium]